MEHKVYPAQVSHHVCDHATRVSACCIHVYTVYHFPSSSQGTNNGFISCLSLKNKQIHSAKLLLESHTCLTHIKGVPLLRSLTHQETELNLTIQANIRVSHDCRIINQSFEILSRKFGSLWRGNKEAL